MSSTMAPQLGLPLIDDSSIPRITVPEEVPALTLQVVRSLNVLHERPLLYDDWELPL